MEQTEYKGPDRRNTQNPYTGPKRRRLDWPFRPLTSAERKEELPEHKATPGRADVKP
jgi:hypothetical protein